MTLRRLFAVLVATITVLALSPGVALSDSTPHGTTGVVVGWGAKYKVPDVPEGLDDVTAIAAGYYHSLALRSDGTVVGWGEDWRGKADVPDGLGGVVGVAAGGEHSLALRSDGTVVAWGEDVFGQTRMPEGLDGVTAIAAGGVHSLALRRDGTVVGWGHEFAGQTRAPEGLGDVTAVAAGGSHSLALRSDGTVVGWGADWYGQATAPEGLDDVIAIAAGENHSLALRRNGTVVGWGLDDDRQTRPPGDLQDAVAIAAGFHHSLALRSDGTVVGWGMDFDGQATPPSDLGPVLAIAAAGYRSLALQRGVVGDTVAPTVTAPENQTVEATGPHGATVTFPDAGASDDQDAEVVSARCAAGDRVSGDVFPLGITEVVCGVTDASGNLGQAAFTVTVRDTTAPMMTMPQSLSVDATSRSGAPVAYTATALDLVDGVLPPGCTPGSGSTFPIGTTTVTCTATDLTGNESRAASFQVTVRSAAEQLDALARAVTGLPGGGAQVRKAQDLLSAGSTQAASEALGALRNHVRGQSGKKLTAAEAAQLTATIDRIRAVLG